MNPTTQRKREEAQLRQTERNQLTPAQQIQRLDARPGKSLRERLRLQKRIANG
jgi:hypothetical protein